MIALLDYLSLSFYVFDNFKSLKDVYYCESVLPSNASAYTNKTMFTLNEAKGSYAT